MSSIRWIGVALIACCLAQTAARGQGMGDCGPCPPQMVPGPISPEQAPPGPGGDCMSLPPGLPNAFSNDCSESCAQYSFSADYILWSIKSPRFSTPLVTTNTNPPVGNNLPTGEIGQDGTIELFRENSMKYSPLSGARINGGFWFDTHQCVSLEGSAFVTQSISKSYGLASDGNGNPLIFVPFFDNQGVGTGTGPGEFGFADAIPGFRTGVVTITSTSQLWARKPTWSIASANCPAAWPPA